MDLVHQEWWPTDKAYCEVTDEWQLDELASKSSDHAPNVAYQSCHRQHSEERNGCSARDGSSRLAVRSARLCDKQPDDKNTGGYECTDKVGRDSQERLHRVKADEAVALLGDEPNDRHDARNMAAEEVSESGSDRGIDAHRGRSPPVG